ncbi:hypothetical protein AB0B06_19370, partial [Streptomyces sp. NPDC044989]|uniref:hypothetical protein n=1 Tax=Streptomyces sp. NPDC044989 TaxID=3154336 RepID=UPI0033D38915
MQDVIAAQASGEFVAPVAKPVELGDARRQTAGHPIGQPLVPTEVGHGSGDTGGSTAGFLIMTTIRKPVAVEVPVPLRVEVPAPAGFQVADTVGVP